MSSKKSSLSTKLQENDNSKIIGNYLLGIDLFYNSLRTYLIILMNRKNVRTRNFWES